jgi:hypothetical protein
MHMHSLTHRRHLPIAVLLTAALLVGIFSVPHYGISWDEADIYRYSQYALDAYRFLLHPVALPKFDTNLNLYGPGYFILANVVARVFVAAIPAWSPITAWHIVYFLTFLAGALTLYLLSIRWMNDLSALGVTLLFLSQPLLWGHAFINPKDIPYMAFFTATIYSGFKMTDDFAAAGRAQPSLIIAAVLLGLTSSFRVAGPWAGLIVLGYAVHKLGRGAIAPAAAYLGVALMTTYLAWPALWAAPVRRYLESLQTMTKFPFPQAILFASQVYDARELPRSYFPTVLAIQLTEPVLVLIVAGLGITVLPSLRGKMTGPFALFLVWFLIPALVVIAAGTPLYDNARQLFFLLPPLFILAGVALERILSFLARWPGRAALLAIVAMPGILAGIILHPYEYVYYNALVGGTGGAYRHYEMDYWATSFKEITNHLNSTAPRGAEVLVYAPGPAFNVERYARPDIHVLEPQAQGAPNYQYVLLLLRGDVDERNCAEGSAIYSVGRAGATFSVLKTLADGTECN